MTLPKPDPRSAAITREAMRRAADRFGSTTYELERRRVEAEFEVAEEAMRIARETEKKR